MKTLGHPAINRPIAFVFLSWATIPDLSQPQLQFMTSADNEGWVAAAPRTVPLGRSGVHGGRAAAAFAANWTLETVASRPRWNEIGTVPGGATWHWAGEPELNQRPIDCAWFDTHGVCCDGVAVTQPLLSHGPDQPTTPTPPCARANLDQSRGPSYGCGWR